jgi:hypothetical protein
MCSVSKIICWYSIVCVSITVTWIMCVVQFQITVSVADKKKRIVTNIELDSEHLLLRCEWIPWDKLGIIKHSFIVDLMSMRRNNRGVQEPGGNGHFEGIARLNMLWSYTVIVTIHHISRVQTSIWFNVLCINMQ